MMTEDDYCDYETSCALSELGFPWEEPGGLDYNFWDNIELYEARKWLRQVKGFDIVIRPTDTLNRLMRVGDYCSIILRHNVIISAYDIPPSSYEQQLFKCIKRAIDILKNEK